MRFGVRREGGRLEAHAWLMLGDAVLLGGSQANAYVPLADFGAGRVPKRHEPPTVRGSWAGCL
ncbi:hypothetical protein CCP1ISM_10030001 [Azospirillaceae bacterium]